MPRFDDGVVNSKLEKGDIILMGNPTQYGEILAENFLVEDITRANLQTLINASELVRGKCYRVTDAVGSTLSLIVQALTANTITDVAYNTINGDLYTYNITADTATQGIVSDVVDFDPQTAPAYLRGRVWYDSDTESLSYYDDISGTSNQIGKEEHVRVRNTTGVTITNGSVVYVSGATGQTPQITLAQANADGTSNVIGIATHDIDNNAFGKVTTFGVVNDVNTLAFAEGSILYLSQSVAGGLTSTRPSAPNFAVIVGICLHSHATQGKILVNTNKQGLGFGTANQLLGINAGATGQEYKTLSGTSNQVTVTNSAGGITLSLPQSIATTSSPTFAGLTVNGLISNVMGTTLYSAVNTGQFANITAGGLSAANLAIGIGGTSIGAMLQGRTSTASSRLHLNPYGGNVLIGKGSIADSGELLQVQGAASVSGNTTIGGDLIVDTNTLFVDSTNNRVGIRTITPEVPLHVLGAFSQPSSASINGGMILSGLGVTSVILNAGIYNAPSQYSWLQSRHASTTNAYYSLVLQPLGGNVGIGTDNPTKKLLVNGTFEATGDSVIGGTLAVTGAVTGSSTAQFAKLGLGGSPTASQILRIEANISGSTTTNSVFLNGVIQNDVTSSAYMYRSSPSTLASAFTLTDLSHFIVVQGTIGATSAITEQNGYRIFTNFTGGATNYGFRGQIPSGAGRWNIYMDGTAANHLQGDLLIGTTSNPSSRKLLVSGTAEITGAVTLGTALGVASGGLGITTTPSNGFIPIGNGTNYVSAGITGTANQVTVTNGAGSITLSLPQSIATTSTPQFSKLGLGTNLLAVTTLRITTPLTGGTSVFGIRSDGIVQSDVTSDAKYFQSVVSTQASVFTNARLTHFEAEQATFGAGSTVTTQEGFRVTANLVGATNNYGFRGQLAVSGTARWNNYHDGTAPNAFVGQTIFGSTTLVTSALVALSSTTQGFRPPVMTTAQRDAIVSPVAGLMIYNTTTNKLNVYTTAWEQVTSA